jgi:hypothetical protein
MHPSQVRRSAGVALLAGGAAVAIAASAGGATSHPAITPAGVGPVKLGATAKSLQAKGLIGKLTTGCELAGPGTRAANVKSFKGTVGFTMSKTRRVNVIAVNGRGPRARGVEVGDTVSDIRKAYRTVKIDKSLEDTLQGDFVRVPKKAGGPIGFFVSTKTGRIETIGVPNVPVCE